MLQNLKVFRFQNLSIINYQWINKASKSIEVIIIKNENVKSIAHNLEISIKNELESYEPPEIKNLKPQFTAIKKTFFKNKEYLLMQKFNSHHRKILRLIRSYNKTLTAIEENYEYYIYFKNGLTYRDDSFLRFVNFVKKGSAKKSDIISHYNGILTEAEVLETINELNTVKLLEFSDDNISITQLGKNIL